MTDSVFYSHLFGFTALHFASKVGEIRKNNSVSGRQDNQKEKIINQFMQTVGAYPVKIQSQHISVPGLTSSVKYWRVSQDSISPFPTPLPTPTLGPQKHPNPKSLWK